jgi:hypothetical protein
MADIPSPNFQALISSPYLVDNTTFPREPVYTELARSILAKLPATPLSTVFPDETIAERIVIAEHVIEGVDTIFPVVEWTYSLMTMAIQCIANPTNPFLSVNRCT